MARKCHSQRQRCAWHNVCLEEDGGIQTFWNLLPWHMSDVHGKIKWLIWGTCRLESHPSFRTSYIIKTMCWLAAHNEKNTCWKHYSVFPRYDFIFATAIFFWGLGWIWRVLFSFQKHFATAKVYPPAPEQGPDKMRSSHPGKDLGRQQAQARVVGICWHSPFDTIAKTTSSTAAHRFCTDAFN